MSHYIYWIVPTGYNIFYLDLFYAITAMYVRYTGTQVQVLYYMYRVVHVQHYLKHLYQYHPFTGTTSIF